MDVLIPTTWQESFSFAFSTTLAQISAFVPQLIAAILVLLIGSVVAKWARKLVVKALKFFKISNLIKKTPVESFLKHADVSTKIENIGGSVVYWSLMLLVFHTAVSLLGLTSLTLVLDRVIAYIPRVISAVLILFFGIIVAGVLESVVKGSVRSVEGKHALTLAKITSYATLVVFIMAGISELGIAQDFILVLFIGVVTMLALAFGLAIGLGSKDLIQDIVETWYKDLQKGKKKK